MQLSVQIRTVILRKVEIKHSSVDVAPTLGVNHVISCLVVLLCCFCYVLLCIDNYIYLISKIAAKILASL